LWPVNREDHFKTGTRQKPPPASGRRKRFRWSEVPIFNTTNYTSAFTSTHYPRTSIRIRLDDSGMINRLQLAMLPDSDVGTRCTKIERANHHLSERNYRADGNPISHNISTWCGSSGSGIFDNDGILLGPPSGLEASLQKASIPEVKGDTTMEETLTSSCSNVGLAMGGDVYPFLTKTVAPKLDISVHKKWKNF
jgi:hypothetical protein